MSKIGKPRPWVALAGAFFLLFTSIGLINGMTLFYLPVAKALGVTQTQFSMHYTLGILASLVTVPLAGRIFTRHFGKMRLIIFLAGLENIACLLLFSRATALWHFYVIAILRSFGTAGISTIPATMMINNWFLEKRSFATSVAFVGSGLGGMAFTQISKYFMAAYNWRVGYIALGASCAVTLAVILLCASPSPQAAGCLPYGYRAAAGERKVTWGLAAAKAFKTPAFWLIGIGLFLGGGVVMGVQQPISTALQVDFKYTAELAASVVSVFLIVICFGKLVIGWIFDRFGLKTGVLYSAALLIVSMVLLMNAGGVVMAYAFAVAFGLGNMNATVTATAVTLEAFGTKEYGAIYGLISALMSAGMALGPVLTSWFYDNLGAYRGAWILYIAVSIVVTALLMLGLVQGKKLRAQYPAGDTISEV